MNSFNQTGTVSTLSARQQRFMKRWEKIRMRSKGYYVLVHGVLKEGLVAMLVVKLLQYIYDPAGFLAYFIQGSFSLIVLAADVLFWLGCGALIGWFKHRSFENEYRLLKELERF